MPEDLKTQINDAAALAGRSLHSELLFRLSASLEKNHSESEFLGAKLRQKEAELDLVKANHDIVHLSNCVAFLLELVREAGSKLTKDDREIIAIAEKAAQDGLKLENSLNPELLLEEYRKTISEAKDMLKVWAPGYLPWPRSSAEDEGALPKKTRARKPKP